MEPRSRRARLGFLSELILADSGRISSAVSTGAAWEIWMQVELSVLLLENGCSVAREVPYPAPRDQWRLDVLARCQENMLAIELKVESANSGGSRLLGLVQQDLAKIVYFTQDPSIQRVVVGLGYSAEARAAMQRFAANIDNDADYSEQQNIGLLLAYP